MARINNTETIKRILDDGGIQTSTDDIPQQLASKVVPVLISNPEKYVTVVKGANKLTTGTANIYTTLADKDFFLTSIQTALVKDAACDVATGQARVISNIEDGSQIFIAGIPVITLTAQETSTGIIFNPPIKLARGSAISHGTTYAAGLCSITSTITGYYVKSIED